MKTVTREAAEIDAPTRVLIIFPGALGDLMCLLPAIKAIAWRHRGSAIDLMARAELARFIVDRIDFVERRSRALSRAHSQAHSIDRREVSALFKASEEIEGSTCAFFSQFEAIYSFFAADDANFRRRLSESCSGTVTFHPFRPPGEGHVAAAYLRSVLSSSSIGALAEFSAIGQISLLEPLKGDLDSAAARLTALGIEPENFVAIFPGSGSTAKNWPAEKFAALATMLAGRAVFVLGPAEAALAPALGAHRFAILHSLELGAVAGIARLARAFVGNDSGAAHLAAAVGARGVVLFGPTDPARWGPLGKVAVIRRAPIASIEPAEVHAAICDLELEMGSHRAPKEA
ncbi:MAG TPA: glycosyltransferase family 9 protein [Candidatus Binataceae bacterium]